MGTGGSVAGALREDIYLGIAKQLKRRRQEREAQVKELVEVIQRRLEQAGIKAQIKGRAKNIFSIWRKMQSKNIPLEDVHDVRAVRIIVDDLANCHGALGIIHSTWAHVPSEFDDYIAVPKENGYQSIHTAITLDDGRSEVQIRTRAMHENASWCMRPPAYKEGGSDLDSTGYVEKMDWLAGNDAQNAQWHRKPAHLLAQRVSETAFTFQPLAHVLISSGSTVSTSPTGFTPTRYLYGRLHQWRVGASKNPAQNRKRKWKSYLAGRSGPIEHGWNRAWATCAATGPRPA